MTVWEKKLNPFNQLQRRLPRKRSCFCLTSLLVYVTIQRLEAHPNIDAVFFGWDSYRRVISTIVHARKFQTINKRRQIDQKVLKTSILWMEKKTKVISSRGLCFWTKFHLKFDTKDPAYVHNPPCKKGIIRFIRYGVVCQRNASLPKEDGISGVFSQRFGKSYRRLSSVKAGGPVIRVRRAGRVRRVGRVGRVRRVTRVRHVKKSQVSVTHVSTAKWRGLPVRRNKNKDNCPNVSCINSLCY